MQKTAIAASALFATTVIATSCGTSDTPAPTQDASWTTTATGTATGANETITIDQTYEVPGDNDEKLTLHGTMVVENGMVKSIDIPDPKGAQVIFANNIAKMVVGKPVAGLRVDAITGASLTVAAFNEFMKNRKS